MHRCLLIHHPEIDIHMKRPLFFCRQKRLEPYKGIHLVLSIPLRDICQTIYALRLTQQHSS